MVAREQRAIANRPVSATQQVAAHDAPAPLRRAPAHGLPPLARVPVGRRVLQRFAWPTGKDPTKLKKEFPAINGWLAETNWPQARTMADWVARAQVNAEVQDSWQKLQTELRRATNAAGAHRHLTVGAGRLKSHIEATYEAPLSEKEKVDKAAHVDNLIKAIPPSALEGVYTREAYKDALVGRVLASPRYMQSIKVKDPYVEHKVDDDASPTGYNAVLIKERIDVVRAGSDLNASLKPGTDTDWERWRGNDCLFAAILKVLLKGKAPTKESDDEAMAGRLADELNVAHGVVDDPVILALMERLGWPYTRRTSWADFTTNAEQGSFHVLSLDMIVSGTASHVVVAGYNTAKTTWQIYDRQAIRLGRAPLTVAPHPANPLDSWRVVESDAAAELRTALS